MDELTDLLNQYTETCIVLGLSEIILKQVEVVPESILIAIGSIRKRKAALGAQIVALFNQAILEAMRDQRHACAEAINGLEGRQHYFDGEPCVRQDMAYQAVFNADARDVERARREKQ